MIGVVLTKRVSSVFLQTAGGGGVGCHSKGPYCAIVRPGSRKPGFKSPLGDLSQSQSLSLTYLLRVVVKDTEE